MIQLDLEGLGSRAAANNFYNGGTDSAGNRGIDYGVGCGPNALASTETDPAANFSREPSLITVLFFLTGTAILNYAPGFDTGFSFFFSTVAFSGAVGVYDGLNATGATCSGRSCCLHSGQDPTRSNRSASGNQGHSLSPAPRRRTTSAAP